MLETEESRGGRLEGDEGEVDGEGGALLRRPRHGVRRVGVLLLFQAREKPTSVASSLELKIARFDVNY